MQAGRRDPLGAMHALAEILRKVQHIMALMERRKKGGTVIGLPKLHTHNEINIQIDIWMNIQMENIFIVIVFGGFL